jgi:hypothetical protein
VRLVVYPLKAENLRLRIRLVERPLYVYMGDEYPQMVADADDLVPPYRVQVVDLPRGSDGARCPEGSEVVGVVPAGGISVVGRAVLAVPAPYTTEETP